MYACMYYCMYVCMYYCMFVLGRLAAWPGTLVAFVDPVGRANKLGPAKAEIIEQDTPVDVSCRMNQRRCSLLHGRAIQHSIGLTVKRALV